LKKRGKMNYKTLKFVVGIVFLGGFALNSALAGNLLPAFIDGQQLPSLAPMLEKTMLAVVNISTTKAVRNNPMMNDPFFRHFFQQPRRRPRQQRNSLGSGVIIDAKKGYIVTNNHVIDKADKIRVTLRDGRQFQAKLLGTDAAADVAVIKIPADGLTALKIADSNRLRVGDFVVAIGNPFGLGQTVTSGIVSALGRSGLGIEGYEDFIQTDASINPGNSGGALVNLRGEFVGMNTAILAPGGGNVGIGFAIPSNMVMTLVESLVEHGEVRRGRLGVTTQDLTTDLVAAFGLKNQHGAIVSRVEAESAAAKAGLEPGDIIVAVNGRAVKNSAQVRNMIGLMEVGDTVTLDVIRAGEKKRLQASVGKPERRDMAGEKLHPRLAGTVLMNSQKGQIEGVLFERIHTGSYAWYVGLRPGDIIVSANRYRVHNLEELLRVTDANKPLLISIQRGGEAFFLVLK
jgi:serine protease Do/serine protease DegQ